MLDISLPGKFHGPLNVNNLMGFLFMGSASATRGLPFTSRAIGNYDLGDLSRTGSDIGTQVRRTGCHAYTTLSPPNGREVRSKPLSLLPVSLHLALTRKCSVLELGKGHAQ